MKVLLTGHKGFIGSHLLRKFTSEGHIVSTYEWGDAYHPPVNGQDWVVHVGAISSTTETDVEKIMIQNVDHSIELYNQCIEHGVNFQFASSASLYGLGKEFKETSPVDPRTPYAWSKYLVERYIRNNPSPARAQIFRYFNVYGTNEEHKGKQASPFTQFKKQSIEQGFVEVFYNSDVYRRDFISVEKIVDLHTKFFDVEESGVWNFGTGKTMSFMEVAKIFSSDIRFKAMPDQLHNSYQQYTCADVTKISYFLD